MFAAVTTGAAGLVAAAVIPETSVAISPNASPNFLATSTVGGVCCVTMPSRHIRRKFVN